MTFWMPAPGIIGGGVVLPERDVQFHPTNKYSASVVSGSANCTFSANRVGANAAGATTEPILKGERVYYELLLIGNTGSLYTYHRFANSFDNNGAGANNTTYGTGVGSWANEAVTETRRVGISYGATGVFNTGTNPNYGGWNTQPIRVGICMDNLNGWCGMSLNNGSGWINSFNPNTGANAAWTWTPQDEIWIIGSGYGGGQTEICPSIANKNGTTYGGISWTSMSGITGQSPPFTTLDREHVF